MPLKINKGDIVKFSHQGHMVAGQVIYVTDYDTVNIVPYDLDFVWAVQVSRIEGVLRKGDRTLTVNQIEEFMDGVFLMLDMGNDGVDIVSRPPSPTLH